MATLFEQDIVSVLNGGGLTAYADVMPQDGTAVFPNVVYTIVPGGRTIRSHGRTVMRKKLVQFTCWGEGETGKTDSLATANRVIQLFDLNKINFELATEESGGGFSIKELNPELSSKILEFYIWTKKE
jgi:hypothetical protein